MGRNLLTARCVVHVLKLQCYYTSLGKLWVVPELLYLEVMAIFALHCSTGSFYKISRSLRIFDNSIIEDY